MKIVVGIDEVGRGPLAGPVTVCIVSCEDKIYKLLKRDKSLPRAGKDSKKLTEQDREKFSKILKKLSKEGKISYSICHISNKVIDSKGISFSIRQAIKNNIKKLNLNPKDCVALLDGGLRAPIEFKNQKTIIKGDEKEKIIAWASILAKVSRDDLMRRLGAKYPNYGFDTHKGYGTEKHRNAIQKWGISGVHRATFCIHI